MVAENRKPDPREIAEKGERIYYERLKGVLEPGHIGEFVVIDVDTGEYEVDANDRAASDRAYAKRPEGFRYAMRVGYPTLGRIGFRGSVGTP